MTDGYSRHSRDDDSRDSGDSSDDTRTALIALKALQRPDIYARAVQADSETDRQAGPGVKKEKGSKKILKRMSELLQSSESRVQHDASYCHRLSTSTSLNQKESASAATASAKTSFRPVQDGSPSSFSQSTACRVRAGMANTTSAVPPKKRKQSQGNGATSKQPTLQGAHMAATYSDPIEERNEQSKSSMNSDDLQRKKSRKEIGNRSESRSSDDHADRSSNSDASLSTKKADSPTSLSDSAKKTGGDSSSDSSSKRVGCDSNSSSGGDDTGRQQERQQHHKLQHRQQHHQQHQHNHQHQKAAPALRTESTQQERRRYLNRLNARKSRERKKNRQEEMRGRLRFLEAETQYLKSVLEENKIVVEPFDWPEAKGLDKPNTPTAT